MGGPEKLTTGGVSRVFGVTLNTVKAWIRGGKISAIRLPSGHYRVPRSEVDRLLQDGGVGGSALSTPAARLQSWNEYESWRQVQPSEHHSLSDVLDWVDSMLRLARSSGPLTEPSLKDKAARIQRLHKAFEVIRRE